MRTRSFTRRATAAVVIAVVFVVTACMGEGEGDAGTEGSSVALASPTTTTDRVLPPSDFVARATPFRVVLTWASPPEEVETYAIYRDGFALTRDLPGSETSFSDDTATPGAAYTYEIQAHAGRSNSDRVAVGVETLLPPLKAARLAGDFAINVRILSQSGYGEYTPSTYGWRFRPRCKEGACNVVWRDLHERRIRATLQRRGARYQGSYTGFFWIECGGARSTSSVTLDLRVTMARVIGNEWRATRVRGTLHQSESSQLGCGSSEAAVAVRGRLSQ